MDELLFWSVISCKGIDCRRMYRRDLYQCVRDAGMFEQTGCKVTIGTHDTILYQSGSLNSQIYCRTLNHRSGRFEVQDRLIANVVEACEYFRYLTNRNQHDGGYWELLFSNYHFQDTNPIMEFEFIWNQWIQNEEVDWMKEGF